MRRALAAMAALALTLALAAPAGAAPRAPSTKDVRSAQQRANAAAGRLAGAQSALARAEREVAALQAKTAATKSRLDSLETEVRSMAVRQYVQGGQPDVLWMGGGADLSEAARGQALLRHIALGRTDAIGSYRAAQEDLAVSQAALRKRLAGQQEAVTRLRRDAARAQAEVAKLAAAQRAYEARLAASRRTTAGRGARGAVVIASGSWICPVQGPRAFSNDWHQPRSGGRLHQGNDILAPRGTPVVASVSGSVRGHHSSLGGISYYLQGDDGNVYFGTHLAGLSGASGRVAAGTVVGYVGNTGNASGGSPHLHSEIHVAGRPVNPYPTLVRYC